MRKRFLDIIVVVITEAMIILGVTLRFTTKMLRLVRMCLGDDDDDDDDGVANDGYCVDSVADDFCDDDNLSLGHLPFLH